MEIEYDSTKSKANKQKHGIDFEEAKKLWEGVRLIVPAKNVRGESRWAVLGKIQKKCYVAIFTQREDAIRIISCHRADRRLERTYEKYFEAEN